LTGTETTTGTKLSTTTKITKSNATTGNKNLYQKPTQSILGVQAWYIWETTYERTRNQIIKLWVSYEIAEHITWEAYTNTDDPKLFIKNIIWVSNAEWSIFKRWLYNNYLGVMECKEIWKDENWKKKCIRYGIKDYDTVQLAITNWREMYNRNKWYVRTTPQRWLDGSYCASECKFWVQNYNAGVLLLNI